MIARRVMRAGVRTIKRLLRPLRVRLISWEIQQSTKELARLRELRADLIDLERIESKAQAQLAMRRMAVERGWK